ncbi:hypothetical protein SLA2020_407350 [Shorea laevis]
MRPDGIHSPYHIVFSRRPCRALDAAVSEVVGPGRRVLEVKGLNLASASPYELQANFALRVCYLQDNTKLTPSF